MALTPLFYCQCRLEESFRLYSPSVARPVPDAVVVDTKGKNHALKKYFYFYWPRIIPKKWQEKIKLHFFGAGEYLNV
ncbi:hypothetical protein F3J29_03590 [Enterobacter sp. Cy-643]|uniref:hypothetical protein n=1 Tax=Enterobacter sp. Cy-643 TaxID=2608346 RepID=UPI00142478FD|nr:hypothetical protein [Enterobacter sp. Cy-643]NIF31221.1 hypothetical protein [Enterobacter sp. Cy-643]